VEESSPSPSPERGQTERSLLSQESDLDPELRKLLGSNEPIPHSRATPPASDPSGPNQESTLGIVSACASSNLPQPIATEYTGVVSRDGTGQLQPDQLDSKSNPPATDASRDPNELALALIEEEGLPDLIDAPVEENNLQLALPAEIIDYETHEVPQERLDNPLSFLPEHLQSVVNKAVNEKKRRSTQENITSTEGGGWRNLKSNFEHFGALRASARRKRGLNYMSIEIRTPDFVPDFFLFFWDARIFQKKWCGILLGFENL